MNFVYISPHFPKTNWEFCDRLKQNGVTVLGIADVEYNELDEKLKIGGIKLTKIRMPIVKYKNIWKFKFYNTYLKNETFSDSIEKEIKDNGVFLPNTMSRKKQIVPPILGAMK